MDFGPAEMSGRMPSASTLPAGFAGGTPGLWDEYMADTPIDVERPFRSAPDRALLARALEATGLREADTVLELGCGSSAFLTRMVLATGAHAAGVDFSAASLERTREAFRRVRLDPSRLVLASIADYVGQHRDEFDVVVSFGMAEHFADLREIVAAHLLCAKPGGRIFIAAPNLSRLNLAWVKAAAPSLLSWHRPLTLEQVAAAVAAAGARDIRGWHVGGVRLFANPDPTGAHAVVPPTAAWLLRKLVNGIGEATYRLWPAGAEHLAGRSASPFFAVAATKTAAPTTRAG
jgi:2-polyprenyl-3-methyl-5-hydroxy-6-metoxy-1,4-benzoquinol methylase